MTVGELIEDLKKFDPSKPVCFKHHAHDYWSTQLGTEIDSIEDSLVCFSDYHGSYKVVAGMTFGSNVEVVLLKGL